MMTEEQLTDLPQDTVIWRVMSGSVDIVVIRSGVLSLDRRLRQEWAREFPEDFFLNEQEAEEEAQLRRIQNKLKEV